MTYPKNAFWLPGLLLLLISVCYAQVEWETCSSLPLPDVEQWLSTASRLLKDEIRRRMVVSVNMGRRARPTLSARGKTWATDMTAEQYWTRVQQEMIPFTGRPRDKRLFTYPVGGESSGYGPGRDPLIDRAERFRQEDETLEQARARAYQQCPLLRLLFESWKSGQYAMRFFIALRKQVPDSASLFMPLMSFDEYALVNGRRVEGACYMTHAELKLIVRRMVTGELSDNQNIFITVSQHVCPNCKKIMLHIAANRRHNFFTIAAKKNPKGPIREEYMWVDGRNGRATVYTRVDANPNSLLTCQTLRFVSAPQGIGNAVPVPADDIVP